MFKILLGISWLLASSLLVNGAAAEDKARRAVIARKGQLNKNYKKSKSTVKNGLRGIIKN